MATTIVQAKHKVINVDGSIVLFHYQTNADIVVDGTTKKVPLITDINNWIATRSEVITARDGLGSLDLRLDRFDTSLLPANLLIAIKTVDGPLSGLNADLVDNCGVDDAAAVSVATLWTSYKTKAELDKKVDDTEVSTVAAANKLLKLDANGKLPASVTGNSGTTSKFATPMSITFSGDVQGSVLFDGSENVTTSIVVADNSHAHSGVVLSGPTTANNTSLVGNLMNFQQAGVTKSSIGSNGDFSGKSASTTKLSTIRTIAFGGDLSGSFTFDGTTDVMANITVNDSDKVGGKTVDDTGTSNSYLWTAAKIIASLGGKLDTTAITSTAATQGRMKIGAITVQWGVVDMASKITAIATFSTPFAAAPFVVLHSDECADFTWISKRKSSSTTAAQTEFISSKSIATAKISWIAIGI